MRDSPGLDSSLRRQESSSWPEGEHLSALTCDTRSRSEWAVSLKYRRKSTSGEWECVSALGSSSRRPQRQNITSQERQLVFDEPCTAPGLFGRNQDAIAACLESWRRRSLSSNRRTSSITSNLSYCFHQCGSQRRSYLVQGWPPQYMCYLVRFRYGEYLLSMKPRFNLSCSVKRLASMPSQSLHRSFASAAWLSSLPQS